MKSIKVVDNLKRYNIVISELLQCQFVINIFDKISGCIILTRYNKMYGLCMVEKEIFDIIEKYNNQFEISIENCTFGCRYVIENKLRKVEK